MNRMACKEDAYSLFLERAEDARTLHEKAHAIAELETNLLGLILEDVSEESRSSFMFNALQRFRIWGPTDKSSLNGRLYETLDGFCRRLERKYLGMRPIETNLIFHDYKDRIGGWIANPY